MLCSHHLLEVSSNMRYRATYMAHAWHTRRQPMAPAHNAGAQFWRATKYEIRDIDGQAISDIDSRSSSGIDSRIGIEAARHATWERFSPFDSYQPIGKARELEPGPHLVFLRLKRLWEEHRERQFQVSDKRWIQREAFLEILRDRSQKKQVRESLKQSRIFRNALIVYAKHYGLLGAFEEDFLGKPVLPGGKTLVAPEALIDKHGRLKRVNPATEGKELLLEVLEPTGLLHPEHSPSRPLDDIDYMVAYETMALPSEMRFALRDPDVGSNEGYVEPPQLVPWEVEGYVEPPQLVPWEEIKRYFGALLILDDRAPDGVSVLCTREPLRRWEISFRFFPSLAAPSGRLQL